ncbi:MAG TPA: ABC transporter ATP-binding protein [Firmicutes bacterium]|jgi:NitT/TauT family transport system ATP-binding protein|nr:ABC transporter ATP-binding protein [Bacillota bacterium]
MKETSKIYVEHICKSFGSLKVFDDFSLEFPEGKISAILGPSGCGKTSLLNILAGLLRVDSGRVATTKEVSYLFQEPRLLPWLTIRENIALVLQGKMAAGEIEATIDENLKATGLTDFSGYYPAQLSGGMLQRAAMARAFAFDAPLLLMDEPFKSLDLKTRSELITNFLQLWSLKPRTVITVTHDIKEGVMLGDFLLVLSGKPAQVSFQRKVTLLQTERSNNPQLMALEQELYQQLLA